MNNVIKDSDGTYHVVSRKCFHHYMTACGKAIHDDTGPKTYTEETHKHKLCVECSFIHKMIKVHS